MWWHTFHLFKLLFGFSPVRLDCLSVYASCRVHEVERMINCAMAKLQSWADVMVRFPLIWMDDCPWFYNTLYELSTDLNGWLSLVLQHVVWAFHWSEWMIVPGFTTRCMSFPLIWMDDCPWFYNTLYELSTDLNGWLSLVLQHVV